QLDGHIDEQPHHFTFVLLKFANDQLSAFCTGLPSDVLEGVTDLIVAELAKIRRTAGAPAVGAGFAVESAPTANGSVHHTVVYVGQHLDSEGVGEGEWNFV